MANNLIFDKKGFDDLVARNKSIQEAVKERKKERNEPKNIERLKEIKVQLDDQLNNQKVYRIPQLSVQKLANEIGCGRTLLSQTINGLYGTTFFDLINNCRVEEAKRLLIDPKLFHLKIDSIGEMAGFSSRTSFFHVFKKSTSLSPTEFRRLNV